jgi:non-specific serine/threonine protein kinase
MIARRHLTALVRMERVEGAPLPAVACDDALVAECLAVAPPMLGGEYLSARAFEVAFASLDAAVADEVERSGLGLAGYLERAGGDFHVAGKVCFHLAENKRHPDAPFAFMATYARGVNERGVAVHAPLARALEEHRTDREALLRLLAPLHEAAKRSAFVHALVERGDVYKPSVWRPAEALALLRDVPVIESAGVVVRLPAGMTRAGAPRPRFTARVGTRAPAGIGLDALLDFELELALDGDPLGNEERNTLLAGEPGLRFLRGRWVEVDPGALRATLDRMERAAAVARRDGLTFAEAVRLLAGVAQALDEPERDAARWSAIEPGPWLAETLAAMRSPRGDPSVDPGDALKATLRPYQRKGVHFLALLTRLGLGACLADDMGLGKTIQVLSLLLLEQRRGGSRPSLLVVPASLLGNWRSEADRFAPSLRLCVAHRLAMDPAALGADEPPDLSEVDLLVTTYGALARSKWLSKVEFDLVILDEAQNIKNGATLQARATRALRARARIALTGTPVENRLDDLHALFEFLNPGLLGSASAFRKQAKAMEAEGGPGYAPLRRLVRPYILRRLKSDPTVAPELPDKTLLTTYAGLTGVQVELYLKVVDQLSVAFESGDDIARRGAVLASLAQLKQICNHPSHYLGDREFDPKKSGKFQRLAELVEPLVERQERALVFTQFREMAEPLAAYLATLFGRSGLILHGGTQVARRKKLVDAFQAHDGPPFMVLSLKAGGVGLNLTAASHVVHFDRWWNPAVENQATDRAYRIGQRKNVFVHAMVCRGTVEERIDAMLTKKRELADEILSFDGEKALTELDRDELVSMVSLDLERAMATAEG